MTDEQALLDFFYLALERYQLTPEQAAVEIKSKSSGTEILVGTDSTEKARKLEH